MKYYVVKFNICHLIEWSWKNICFLLLSFDDMRFCFVITVQNSHQKFKIYLILSTQRKFQTTKSLFLVSSRFQFEIMNEVTRSVILNKIWIQTKSFNFFFLLSIQSKSSHFSNISKTIKIMGIWWGYVKLLPLELKVEEIFRKRNPKSSSSFSKIYFSIFI